MCIILHVIEGENLKSEKWAWRNDCEAMGFGPISKE
jgi:hypothetical protein